MDVTQQKDFFYQNERKKVEHGHTRKRQNVWAAMQCCDFNSSFTACIKSIFGWPRETAVAGVGSYARGSKIDIIFHFYIVVVQREWLFTSHRSRPLMATNRAVKQSCALFQSPLERRKGVAAFLHSLTLYGSLPEIPRWMISCLQREGLYGAPP